MPEDRAGSRGEHSVRKDYDVLDGYHRIILTPTGLLHEQHNWKRVSGDANSAPEELPSFLSAEIGLDRYERIISPSLDLARDYWEKSGSYWAVVRRVWDEVSGKKERCRGRDP